MGSRWGSDLVWLWLWCRLAPAAPIRPLAWELPYASDVALKKKKSKRKEKKPSILQQSGGAFDKAARLLYPCFLKTFCAVVTVDCQIKSVILIGHERVSEDNTTYKLYNGRNWKLGYFGFLFFFFPYQTSYS